MIKSFWQRPEESEGVGEAEPQGRENVSGRKGKREGQQQFVEIKLYFSLL